MSGRKIVCVGVAISWDGLAGGASPARRECTMRRGMAGTEEVHTWLWSIPDYGVVRMGAVVSMVRRLLRRLLSHAGDRPGGFLPPVGWMGPPFMVDRGPLLPPPPPGLMGPNRKSIRPTQSHATQRVPTSSRPWETDCFGPVTSREPRNVISRRCGRRPTSQYPASA